MTKRLLIGFCCFSTMLWTSENEPLKVIRGSPTNLTPKKGSLPTLQGR